MRTTVRLIAAICGLALAPFASAGEQAVPSTRPDSGGKLRVLIITGGHSFDRKAFFEVFSSQPDIVWKEAAEPDAQQYFSPEKAGEYDVMVWYDLFSKSTDQSKENLVKLLREGKPLVVMHHALADYQDWPEAIKIIGGHYYTSATPTRPRSGYTHGVNVHVKIADPNHPITQSMKDFDIVDEVYRLYDVLPEARPLLTTDHPESAKVIGWTHHYGKSRVVYIELGHGPTAYKNASFRRLVSRSILWVAGRLPEASKEGAAAPVSKDPRTPGAAVTTRPASP